MQTIGTKVKGLVWFCLLSHFLLNTYFVKTHIPWLYSSKFHLIYHHTFYISFFLYAVIRLCWLLEFDCDGDHTFEVCLYSFIAITHMASITNQNEYFHSMDWKSVITFLFGIIILLASIFSWSYKTFCYAEIEKPKLTWSGFGIGLLSGCAILFFVKVLHLVYDIEDGPLIKKPAWGVISTLASIGLFFPACEEIVFRGLFFYVLINLFEKLNISNILLITVFNATFFFYSHDSFFRVMTSDARLSFKIGFYIVYFYGCILIVNLRIMFRSLMPSFIAHMCFNSLIVIDDYVIDFI